MKKLLGAGATVSLASKDYERRKEFMRGSIVKVEGMLDSRLSF